MAFLLEHRTSAHCQSRSTTGQRKGAYTIMRKLLLLAFMTVAWEAMAQDAQCVRERAGMVETIRSYARSAGAYGGAQGISERVLEGVGNTQRHPFIAGRTWSVAYRRRAVAMGQGTTIMQP